MKLAELSQAHGKIPLLTGLLVIILFCSVYYFMPKSGSRLISSLDSQVFSSMFRFRGMERTTGRVVIVDIDEVSLKELGQWPWSRNILAKLVNRIEDAKPVALGLDIIFPEKDRSSPSNWLNLLEKKASSAVIPDIKKLKAKLKRQSNYNFDTILGNALFQQNTITGFAFVFSKSDALNVNSAPFVSSDISIVPKHLSFSSLNFIKANGVVLNIPDIDQGESQGFINVFPDAGGTIHAIPLFISFNSVPYPSLALETARIGLKLKEITIIASRKKINNKNTIIGIALGKRFIPTDNFGKITVNYRGPSKTFKYCSAIDVINGRCKSVLKDKYVLVGTSAAGLSDLRSTPFSNVFPGVEVHATVIDNILKQDAFKYDKFTETIIIYLIVILGGLALTIILTFASPLVCGISGIGFVLIVLGGNYRLFFMNHQLIGVMYPLISMAAVFASVTTASFFFKEREKAFIQKAFAHYISPTLVNQLIKQPEKLSLDGSQKEVTVFFSDIRNFTMISEKTSSEKIAKLLNLYLTAMTDIILDRQGMVDKYIGDAIMAIWGVPLDDPCHAENAMKAGLEMADALKRLNAKLQSMGFPKINIGMGLNTGIVNVGNFGTSTRFDYTVVGKHVNLASRLEALNKYYGTSFLVSESTMNMAGDKFYCRFVDIVRVKGMDEPVKIFEPICMGDPSRDIMTLDSAFCEAFSLYAAGQLGKAKEKFEKLSKQENRQVNAVFLERINDFMEKAPSYEWKGVYTFGTK